MKSFYIIATMMLLFSCSPLNSASIDQQSLSSSDSLNKPPQPPKPQLTNFGSQLKDLASQSVCLKTSFIGRGRAPAGFVKGMVLTYARSLCRIKSIGVPKPAAIIMKSANSTNASKDVLAHYFDVLSRLGVRSNSIGDEPLHATYTIGFGLGMRESSGKYCEGWDQAAGSNRDSSEAEAGLFQASFNSVSDSIELKKLYDEYLSNPKRCLVDVFKEGVTCKAQSILGTGAGAAYQIFNKQCPAFATEYAMTLVRLQRSHFGPLNRKEAQVVPACESLLTDVQNIVNRQPDSVCAEIF